MWTFFSFLAAAFSFLEAFSISLYLALQVLELCHVALQIVQPLPEDFCSSSSPLILSFLSLPTCFFIDGGRTSTLGYKNNTRCITTYLGTQYQCINLIFTDKHYLWPVLFILYRHNMACISCSEVLHCEIRVAIPMNGKRQHNELYYKIRTEMKKITS